MPSMHSYDDRLATLTARNLAASRRFAGIDARRVPGGLRRPYSTREWLALDGDARIAHLTTRAAEEAALRLAKAPAAAAGPAPVTPPTQAPVVEYTAGRYVVSCACGCGLMLPARGPRPVLAFCRSRTRRAA